MGGFLFKFVHCSVCFACSSQFHLVLVVFHVSSTRSTDGKSPDAWFALIDEGSGLLNYTECDECHYNKDIKVSRCMQLCV